jgi:DNA-binding response OmpR family regulator
MKQTTGTEASPTAIMTALPGATTRAFAIGTVLSISPIEDDHNSLEQILSAFRLTLHRALTLASAMLFLAENHEPVVICERDLTPGTWKDILGGANVLPQPPCIIVTSRLADEHLWVEALNVGAYDVLAKPFETEEVVRSVISASRSWHDQYLHTRVPRTPRLHAA